MGLVVADQRLVQEAVALLIAVAVEGLLLGLILNGCVQCVDNSRYQRTGYVADAQTDDISLRMCASEYSRTLRAMVENR